MLAIVESLSETGSGGVGSGARLQDRESKYSEFATASQLSLLLTSSRPAHPGSQASHPLFLSLPSPAGFFWVVVSTWGAFYAAGFSVVTRGNAVAVGGTEAAHYPAVFDRNLKRSDLTFEFAFF